MNASSNDFGADSSSIEMLKSFTTAGPNGGSLESLPAMTAHELSALFTRFHQLTYRQNVGRSLGRMFGRTHSGSNRTFVLGRCTRGRANRRAGYHPDTILPHNSMQVVRPREN